MTHSRRAALGLVAGAGLFPFVPSASRAAADTTATREFQVLRGGSDIGRPNIALRREGDRLDVAIDIELVVRVLGVAAYRYEMTNRETWEGGRLIRGDSRVNDDGKRKRVISTRENGVLTVDSPDHSGAAPDNLATTTYFTTDFLKRPVWMSTDSGDLFDMAVERRGSFELETAVGKVPCARWHASNGRDYDVDIYYDERGEWLSVGFDAGGTRAWYRPLSIDDRLGALWTRA